MVGPPAETYQFFFVGGDIRSLIGGLPGARLGLLDFLYQLPAVVHQLRDWGSIRFPAWDSPASLCVSPPSGWEPHKLLG